MSAWESPQSKPTAMEPGAITARRRPRPDSLFDAESAGGRTLLSVVILIIGQFVTQLVRRIGEICTQQGPGYKLAMAVILDLESPVGVEPIGFGL